MTAPAQQKNIFSPYWYRVAPLVPRLRAHVQMHSHTYRGQTWYVLQDHSSGRFHRFSVAAYQLIGLMDGRHTMDEIWKHAGHSLGEDSLTQAQAIQLLAQFTLPLLLVYNRSSKLSSTFSLV